MRTDTFVVFDDYVKGTTPVATSADFYSRLGAADQVSWHIVADNVSGTDTLNVNLHHSADGRNWTTNAAGGVAPKTTSTLSVNASVTNSGMGADQGLTPSLGLVRFEIYFNAAATTGHVKIMATCRDSGG